MRRAHKSKAGQKIEAPDQDKPEEKIIASGAVGIAAEDALFTRETIPIPIIVAREGPCTPPLRSACFFGGAFGDNVSSRQ